MREDMVAVYQRLRNVHAEVYATVSQVREQMKQVCDIDEHADVVYACHETMKYLDDIRTEINKLNDQCEKIACAIWVREGTGETIRTSFCTVSPEVKIMASIPRKKTDPDSYNAFMRSLGVSDDVLRQPEDVVRPHWPGLVEYVSRLAAAGKPLPPGVDPDKTYPVYTLHIRAKRKGVDE